MIVTIHQPHLLPWLGYFDRMMKADLFILLDDVQFTRQNYQNRVRIKTGEGARWLTVPVQRNSRDQRIMDKEIDNQKGGRLRWGRKAYLTLQYAYRGAPFFDLYAPVLWSTFEDRWEKLYDLNLELIKTIRDALEIRTPMVRSSELRSSGAKSERILGLCRAAGADTLLAGLGGCRDYLDLETFRRAGIKVVWQDFQHPLYKQHPCPETFLKGLSALDMLFNCGPGSRAILREEASYAASAA